MRFLSRNVITEKTLESVFTPTPVHMDPQCNTTSSTENALDLHDIALLLNYERGSTEPRFRHTKLLEVVTSATADFQTIHSPSPYWDNATTPRTGLVFKRKLPARDSPQGSDEPDLPSNMIPSPTPENLRNLDSKTLETLYWQARDHDACYHTIVLFQYFIDLFPDKDEVILRVRTIDNDTPKVYNTPPSDRVVMEIKLFNPKSVTVACVFPNKTYISGGQPSIYHAVFGFSPPGAQGVESIDILDLASLQFGDAGRGLKGRGLFVLEPLERYLSRLDNLAESNDFASCDLSLRIIGSPDQAAWLQQVARRVKERWDNRHKEHWCGHCGAPADESPLQACSKCHGVYYCNRDHQVAAWPFHKHFCAA